MSGPNESGDALVWEVSSEPSGKDASGGETSEPVESKD
jgi:hypothetical protein